MTELIFHITTREQWQRAQQAGLYHPESLDTDGFIHCSTAAQVVPVANFYYRGQTDLVVLGIDVTRSGVEVRYETGYTGDLFPHLYGALPVPAVCQVIDLEPDPSGNFALPGGNFALPGGNFALPGGNFALPGGNFALPGGSLTAPEGLSPHAS